MSVTILSNCLRIWNQNPFLSLQFPCSLIHFCVAHPLFTLSQTWNRQWLVQIANHGIIPHGKTPDTQSKPDRKIRILCTILLLFSSAIVDPTKAGTCYMRTIQRTVTPPNSVGVYVEIGEYGSFGEEERTYDFTTTPTANLVRVVSRGVVVGVLMTTASADISDL